jgi:hypothetical protein
VIERGQRRRLRERKRDREDLLLDLGALVYELHRQGRRAPDLLQRKASQLTVVDDEVRELEAALGVEDDEPFTEEVGAPDLEAELAQAEQAGDSAEVHDIDDDAAPEEDDPAPEEDDPAPEEDDPAVEEHEHEEPRA